MELDLALLRQTFLEEAADYVTHMETSLLTLGERPDDRETLMDAFRAAHTLKGDAGCVGYTSLAAFAHVMESVLQAESRRGSLLPAVQERMLAGVDVLRRLLLAAPEAPLEADEQAESMRLAALARSLSNPTPVPAPAGPGAESGALIPRWMTSACFSVTCARAEHNFRIAGVPEDRRPPEPTCAELGCSRAGELEAAPGKTGDTLPTADAPAQAGSTSSAQAPAAARSLRVGVDKLDALVDLAGEIATAQGRLAGLIQELDDSRRASIQDAWLQTERLRLEMQGRILRTRLLPLHLLFQSYTRAVHDLARNCGKEVHLDIQGGDTEADLSLVESLREPLTHLIRNAVDHGIEPPGARRAAGKHPVARVTLAARRDAGHLVVTVSDDGAGLSRERIAERAVSALGLGHAAELGDEALFALIFESGFSTADRVTDISGRGLGLDIVRRAVQALRGTIAVASEPGVSTTFTLRLPLSVSILEGFRVTADGEDYVFPMDAVLECLDVPADPHAHDHLGVAAVRDHALPYLRLNGTSCNGRARLLVLSAPDGRRAGVEVDAFHGAASFVIKPKGGMFRGIATVSAFTVLEDGRVAMVLDVAELVANALHAAAQRATPDHEPPVNLSPAQPA